MKTKVFVLMVVCALFILAHSFPGKMTPSHAQTYCSCAVTCSGCQFSCTGWDIGRASWECCKEAAKVTPLDCGAT